MKHLIKAITVAAMFAVSGCASTSSSVSAVVEPTYEGAAASKFVAANREAIGRMVAGVDLKAVAGAPILVATVVNVNDLRRTAPLGRTLSEQYASHLVSSGFNVKELKLRGDVFVREETGELMLSREIKDIAKSHSASAVLVGTYSAAAQYTFVSLKLVRTDSGQIIRGYDFALPNDADVRKLLQTP